MKKKKNFSSEEYDKGDGRTPLAALFIHNKFIDDCISISHSFRRAIYCVCELVEALEYRIHTLLIKHTTTTTYLPT